MRFRNGRYRLVPFLANTSGLLAKKRLLLSVAIQLCAIALSVAGTLYRLSEG
ncbi:hypothetical protein [Stenomitos frigidus]|uniref:hypothetical protein n=1 Tax=Stenomitos frigidus TaxID=1886765 RepID=UPI0015E6E22F|nr:hypothetical protein [Stenomitos frigidus]